MKNLSIKAFTIIELIIVITIIGIISSIVIIQVNGANNASKDALRMMDIKNIANAVVLYSVDHQRLKPSTNGVICEINNNCPIEISQALTPYLEKIPTDPNSGTYYKYISNGDDCKISASLSNGKTYEYSCSDGISVAANPVDGVCGSLSNTASTAFPASTSSWPSNEFCLGTTIDSNPDFPSAGSFVSWTCPGLYLGDSTSCTAYHSQDGVCGSLSNTASTAFPASTSSWPSSNYCLTGTVNPTEPSFPDKGSYTDWTCNGIYTDSFSSCTAYHAQNGECGSSDGATLTSPPTTNLCLSGTASTSGSWSWDCNGTYNGSNDSCSALAPIDYGSCGNNAQKYAPSVTDWPSRDSSAWCSYGTAYSFIPGNYWTTGDNFPFPVLGQVGYWYCKGNGSNPGSVYCTAGHLPESTSQWISLWSQRCTSDGKGTFVNYGNHIRCPGNIAFLESNMCEGHCSGCNNTSGDCVIANKFRNYSYYSYYVGNGACPPTGNDPSYTTCYPLWWDTYQKEVK